MTPQRMAPALFAASALLAFFFYASFFVNFSTTLSDWSGFGFTWTHQMFHNFLHGRAFQSSLFATLDAGSSVGFAANPYAFIHAAVIHVNFTPFLFAPLWALHPSPAAIYGIIFAWNLTAGAWLSRSILRRANPPDGRRRLLLAWSVLAFGGLLAVLCQMAQLLLFAGPFMLGVYDAYLARRRWAFVLWIAALALVSEDAAMIAACFGVYLLLFEEDGRAYGAAALAVSVPYVLFVLAVLQPAARADLTLTGSTATAVVVKMLFSLSGGPLVSNLLSMLPLLAFLPAFGLAAGLFGVPDRRGLIRAAGLAAVPAFLHWGECVVVGGAHHLLPPWFGLFLGLLSWLRDARGPALPRLAVVSAAAFFAVGLRLHAGHLPLKVKPALLRAAGRSAQAAELERRVSGAEASNRAVIAAASSIPLERSLVFLADNRVSGFIVGRSRVWDFPEHYDRADYLLVQKDAIDANYSFKPAPGTSLRETLKGTPRLNERNQKVGPEMVSAIRSSLLVDGGYRVALENEHVLLLERVDRMPFEEPPATWGFGWTRGIGRRAAWAR